MPAVRQTTTPVASPRLPRGWSAVSDPGRRRIWYPSVETKKQKGKKEMLLCQTRFLGNYSCNYFSVPNPLALLTFSTCLISSSDFRNKRADIWGGGDQHPTPDSFSSLMSIISPCVPVLTEDDLGVPRLCCLQLLPMLVPLPRTLFLALQSIPGSAQVSLPLGPLSCTTIPFNSPPPPSKKHMYMFMARSFFFFKMSKETCVTYWKKKRNVWAPWRRGFLPYPPSFSGSSLFLAYNGGSQNAYLNQWIFSVGYAWLLKSPKRMLSSI